MHPLVPTKLLELLQQCNEFSHCKSWLCLQFCFILSIVFVNCVLQSLWHKLHFENPPNIPKNFGYLYLICWFITIDKVLVDNFLRPPRSHFYFWPPEIWRPALPPLLFLISFFSSWMRAHKTIVIKMWWFPQHFLGIIPPTTNDKGCNGNRNIWRFQAPCVTFGSPLKAASRSCTLVGWKKIWDNFDLFSKTYKVKIVLFNFERDFS